MKRNNRLFRIIGISLIILLAFAYFFTDMILVPASKYRKAKELIYKGESQKAYFVLTNVDYMDSEELRAEIALSQIAEKEVGDTFYFGTYERQDVLWRVLDKKDDKVLVISDQILFSEKYNKSEKEILWADSSIRRYLNNDFLKDCFSAYEQKAIVSTIIENGDAQLDFSEPEADTQVDSDVIVLSTNGESVSSQKNIDGQIEDKVFLLSYAELNNYFHSDEERKAFNTKGNKKGWWIRSPESESLNKLYVSFDGSIDMWGDTVDNKNGIRPSMWIVVS